MTRGRLAVPDPTAYWEERAERFASAGRGLKAVCSYGMPSFHNAAIDLCQRLALRPWLRPPPGTRVLDVGCGVGRWSCLLARRGARVTGVDLAPAMVREAERRAARDGVLDRCRFHHADLARLDLGCRFPLVIGVTVLQHILDGERLVGAVRALAAHLAPGGRLVLLEAAPGSGEARCETPVFRARALPLYLDLFASAGLRLVGVSGVDPMPLRTRFLPYYPRLPRLLALAGLAAVTALSLPVDLAFGRRGVARSWHKVIVLGREGAG